MARKPPLVPADITLVNRLPKLKLLRQFGFYPEPEPTDPNAESCGAHSPRVQPQELATRVET